ncbi:hypothetical protein CN354_14475 [Bacillus cereus]|nr:hypothetical protein CN354_14475 [Bacillus cereus]
MGNMVMKLGMIGYSPNNGHPYSFSSIINGYDSFYLQQSGWDIIEQYLNRKDKSEFGLHEVQVTHAWTQDRKTTELLTKSCFIPHALDSFHDMIGNVDAVIIARDDHESHSYLAMPFLKENIPVFIDKPLTTNLEELKMFIPFMKNALLTSCSGFRYATELDCLAEKRSNLGIVKLYRGTIVNDWEKYGIHLLEGFISRLHSKVIKVKAMDAHNDIMSIYLSDQTLIQIQAIKNIYPLFLMEWMGEKEYFRAEIKDNFTMFRRMLWHFIRSIRLKLPAINYNSTLEIIYTLIAGNISKQENKEVYLDDIRL